MRKVGGGTPLARDEARSLSRSESLALFNSDVTPIDGPSTGNAKEASAVEIRALRGVLRSGADGAYELRTIVPGHYGRRARHIHFLFYAYGCEPFVTQSYFPDDPRVATDPIARRPILGQMRLSVLLLACLSLGRPAAAKLLIVGNDEKVSWDDGGKLVLAQEGRDTVSIHRAVGPRWGARLGTGAVGLGEPRGT